MKAGKYAVSIQYGGGHHFFTWTGDEFKVFTDKLAAARGRCQYERAQKGRGAKPTAHGWRSNPGVYDDVSV